MEKLITRNETAELLRKPVSWLRYAERRRLIPFVKVGQQIRYRLTDILAFIQDQTVQSVPHGPPPRTRNLANEGGEP